MKPTTLEEAVDYYVPRFAGGNWLEDDLIEEDNSAAYCHSQLSVVGMRIRS